MIVDPDMPRFFEQRLAGACLPATTVQLGLTRVRLLLQRRSTLRLILGERLDGCAGQARGCARDERNMCHGRAPGCRATPQLTMATFDRAWALGVCTWTVGGSPHLADGRSQTRCIKLDMCMGWPPPDTSTAPSSTPCVRVWFGWASLDEARPGGSGNPDLVGAVIETLVGCCAAMECAYVDAHAYRDAGAFGREEIVGWVVDALARYNYATPQGCTPRVMLRQCSHVRQCAGRRCVRRCTECWCEWCERQTLASSGYGQQRGEASAG